MAWASEDLASGPAGGGDEALPARSKMKWPWLIHYFYLLAVEDRKLFIGMVSKKCNENDIRVMFSPFGQIGRMPDSPSDGLSRGECARLQRLCPSALIGAPRPSRGRRSPCTAGGRPRHAPRTNLASPNPFHRGADHSYF